MRHTDISAWALSWLLLPLLALGCWIFEGEAMGALAAPVSPPPGPVERPTIDLAGVVLYPDQGRLDVKGTRLQGTRVRWQTTASSGEDACLDPKAAGGPVEQCSFAVAHDTPATATFRLLAPPTAPAVAPGATEPSVPLQPARIVLDRLLPATSAVDLTNGVGRIPLAHPEAVAAVECAQARCELVEGTILVRASSGAGASLTLRLRLAPHYYLARGDAVESTITHVVSVLHCPAAVVSGDPLRHAEATRIIVRLDDRCGHDARDLRWTVNARTAEVQRVERVQGAVYAQLAAGEIEEAQVTITATRPEPDDTVIAVLRADTRPPPQPRALLELPGVGKIGFIPTNRDALLRTGPAGDHARLIPLPVEGAYHVNSDGQTVRVRGEESGGGFVALRFGYRIDALPAPFASTDLAILTEPIQRPIREASVPAPIGASALTATPLVELVCADRQGHPQRIEPGARASIAFPQRDSCRLVIHRERLKPEEGTQDISVEVNVTKVDDSARPEAHISERMVIRPGPQPRVFWIHGVRGQFDRVNVRVAHVVDEAHDVSGAELRVDILAAQWAVVVGDGHLRFYATAAIPTGLFRITAPSDVLTLNFGALSRLTWLNSEGEEGLLGLEFGALGIGLAATPGFPRTLAVLTGVGVSVPIGNRGEKTQASVNLHAWLAYELRDEYHLNPSDSQSPLARHVSFLFGPSITIGNVGTNL